MRTWFLIFAVAASQGFAQAGLRDSDVALTRAELTEILSDQVLEFYTDGLATYWADGRYDYRYEPGGQRVPGHYEINDDSTVCTAFLTGFQRCDYFVRANERIVMIIENGERYPVRQITPIE